MVYININFPGNFFDQWKPIKLKIILISFVNKVDHMSICDVHVFCVGEVDVTNSCLRQYITNAVIHRHHLIR